MTDFETRLLNERRRVAEGYEIPGSRAAGAYGFDAGIAFMREVVAKKDTEIAELLAQVERLKKIATIQAQKRHRAEQMAETYE